LSDRGWLADGVRTVHSCGTTASATGFDDSIIARGTHFVPLKDH
jgi:hypothetical protein